MIIRILLLAASLAAPATAQPSRTGINFYSIAREAELGLDISDNLRANVAIVDEPRVARITATLAPHAISPFDYRILVFDDAVRPVFHQPLAIPVEGSTIEPLTIAGGWIFAPYSLVNRIADDSQLAAMLAHSMAHVALRHATRLATKMDLLEMSLDVLPARTPAVVPVVMTGSFSYVEATFARSFELQADAAATTTLAASGYDPHALIDYIRTQSIPNATRRISRIEAALTSPPTPVRPDPRP